MITENLSTLKINKLTQEQYDRELIAGNIDENALYLTPDETIDLSEYAIKNEVSSTYETKSDASAKLTEAKTYADNAATKVKNDVLESLDEYDFKVNEHTHDFYTLTNNPITTNDADEIIIVDANNNELMKVNNTGITVDTVTANKVYGAVWNDYAEWFEKENLNDKFEVGDICSWYENGVVLATSEDSNVIGVVSNTYGHILGGNPLADMEENHKNFVPIGLVGRVKVKVLGTVNKGDLIVSVGNGIGYVNNEASIRQVVGKALESSNDKNIKLITVLIK